MSTNLASSMSSIAVALPWRRRGGSLASLMDQRSQKNQLVRSQIGARASLAASTIPRLDRSDAELPAADESAIQSDAVSNSADKMDAAADPVAARMRVEAALFLSPAAVTPRRLSVLAGLCDATAARTAVNGLNEFYGQHDRALRVESVAGGFRMMTRPHLSPWLSRLSHLPTPVRLSLPMLETLAVVAYRGPVSRADIESIRGVACGELLRQLISRDFVKVAGRSEELGRPYLYDTTKRFLQTFGLRSTDDLPTIRLDDIGQQFADCATSDEPLPENHRFDPSSVPEPSEDLPKEPVVSTSVCTTTQNAADFDRANTDLDRADMDLNRGGDATPKGLHVTESGDLTSNSVDPSLSDSTTVESEVASAAVEAVIEDEEDDLYEDDGNWDDDDDDWDDPDDDDDIDLGDDDEDSDDEGDDDSDDEESSDLDDDWEEVDDDESDDEFEGDDDVIDDDEDWGEDDDEDSDDEDDSDDESV